MAGEWLASPVAWVAILCAGTFGALPKVWVMGGVRLIGSTRAAVALLTEPVVAVVVAAVFLGQRLTLLELVGGAAILVAVVLVQLPPGARRSVCRWRRAERLSSRRAAGGGRRTGHRASVTLKGGLAVNGRNRWQNANLRRTRGAAR